MESIKERLDGLARRLATRAEECQYLFDEFGKSLSGSSENPIWQTPVELPPKNEIPPLQAKDDPPRKSRPEVENQSDREKRRIRPAFLSTYFLREWFEWKVLSRRWVKFYGASSIDQLLYSVSPEVLDRAGSRVVSRLADTRGYLEAYGEFMRPQAISDLNPDDGDSAVSWIIQFGEHDRLVRGLWSLRRERIDKPPDVYRELIDFFDSGGEMVIERLPDLVRESEVAKRQLRAYKYSSLSLSWLRLDEADEDSAEYHLIDQIYNELEKLNRSSQERIYDAYFFHDDLGLFKTVDRIRQTVREISLGRFLQTVTEREFQSGSETPVGDRTVKVIGGGEQNPVEVEGREEGGADLCITLSISDEYYPEPPFADGDQTDGTPGSELRRRMRDLGRAIDQTMEWLIRHGSTGTAVLIITDLWVPKQFESQYKSVFEAFSDQGISTLIAVPDSDGTDLTLVEKILP